MKYEPILSQMAGRAAHAIHQNMKYFRPILLQWKTGFNYIPKYEVWMNIATNGGSSGTLEKKAIL